MTGQAKIGAIILAAGSSSRLGFPKQLVLFKGKSLLQHAIDNVNSGNYKIKFLVLGSNSDEIKSQIQLGEMEAIFNDHWEEGMSSSIRIGLKRALEIEQDLEHLLILVSDQPLVSEAHLQKLVDTQLEAKSQATFSEYEGDIGVPAIFSKAVFHELQNLKGDHGAKKLIHKESFQYHKVRFKEGDFDIDTPGDIELLKKLEG